MQIEKIKEEVAFFTARLYQRGLTTTTGGCISLRLGSVMAITPRELDRASLLGKDIALVDISTGENLTKDKCLMIESEMHRLVYLKRKDIFSVVHSPSTYSCLYSASKEEVNTSLVAESGYLLDKVVRVEYNQMDRVELREKVCSLIEGGHNALLLAYRGALCVGKTVSDAFNRLECLEEACRLTFLSHFVETINLTDEQKEQIALMR